MVIMSIIQNIAKDIIQRMIYESKHGHLLDMKSNEYISIHDFFSNRIYLERCDWKWGLKWDEKQFIIEYYDYFRKIKNI